MSCQSQPLRDAMHLVAYDLKGAEVFEQILSLEEYYEELHPVIDEDDFRSRKGIARLVGTKHDESGAVEERWENAYDASGAYVSGTVRDKNGNVVSQD